MGLVLLVVTILVGTMALGLVETECELGIEGMAYDELASIMMIAFFVVIGVVLLRMSIHRFHGTHFMIKGESVSLLDDMTWYGMPQT